MTNTLSHVLKTMSQLYGTDLSVYDGGFLAKTVAARQQAVGLPQLDAYVRRLEESAEEAQALAAAFQITFTEFFRDPVVFAQMERHVLPDLVRRKEETGNEEIRVWSAGCATGQEAYSLAMLLSGLRTGDGSGGGVRFRIFATDISPAALDFARAGVYDRDQLRNVRLQYADRHFVETGSGWAVREPLRQAVSFSLYDLLDTTSAHPPECIFGDFDLIFCSNLLFYYQPAQQRFIVRKLLKALSSDGCLVTGDTEGDMVGRAAQLPPLHLAVPIFRRSRPDR